MSDYRLPESPEEIELRKTLHKKKTDSINTEFTRKQTENTTGETEMMNEQDKRIPLDDSEKRILKQKWNADESLQADFPLFEDYVNYMTPVDGVKFKSIGGK